MRIFFFSHSHSIEILTVIFLLSYFAKFQKIVLNRAKSRPITCQCCTMYGAKVNLSKSHGVSRRSLVNYTFFTAFSSQLLHKLVRLSLCNSILTNRANHWAICDETLQLFTQSSPADILGDLNFIFLNLQINHLSSISQMTHAHAMRVRQNQIFDPSSDFAWPTVVVLRNFRFSFKPKSSE